MNRAREVDQRDGAAIMFGLVDGIDVLAPTARGFLLDVAESWPHRKLREAANALRRSPTAAPTPALNAFASPSATARSAAQASLF